MKWELWKDHKDKEHYIIAHPYADPVRKKLPQNAKVIWSCEVSSPFEAQYQYLKYKGAWFRIILLRLEKIYKPGIYGETYKEMGWE